MIENPLRAAFALVAIGAVAAASAACGLLAGIEDFHFVENDADAFDAASDAGLGAPDAPNDADPIDAMSDANAGGDADGGVVPVDGGPCGACSVTATCVQNTCVETLVNGLDDPRSIVTVGGYIVWAEYASGADSAGKVRACPLAGCPVTGPLHVMANRTRPRLRRATGGQGRALLLADKAGSGGTVADVWDVLDNLNVNQLGFVDRATTAVMSPTTVVWADQDSVQACARASCTKKVLVSNASANPITGPAIGIFGDDAYWTPPFDGIAQCSVSGACIAGAQPLFAGESVVDFDVDVQGVYAAADRGALLSSPSIFGKGAIALPAQPSAVVASPSAIYVACSTAGVQAAARSNGALTLKGAGTPIDLTLAGGFVYWTDASGSIKRAPM